METASTFNQKRSTIDPVIQENEESKLKFLQTFSRNFNKKINKSLVYNSNQPNLPLHCLQYIQYINNQQQKFIIQESVLIHNHHNNLDNPILQQSQYCQSQQLDYYPPVEFHNQNVYLQSSSPNLSQYSDEQEYQQMKKQKIFWMKQVAKMDNFLTQLLAFHKAKIKQLYNMLANKSKTKRRGKNIKKLDRKVNQGFHKKINNTQKIIEGEQRQNNLLPCKKQKQQMQISSILKQICYNIIVPTQKSSSVINTNLLIEQLSHINVNSNLNQSNTYECHSFQNYQNNLQSSGIIIPQKHTQQLVYKSFEYSKRKWQFQQSSNQIAYNQLEKQKKQIKSFQIVTQKTVEGVVDKKQGKMNLRKLFYMQQQEDKRYYRQNGQYDHEGNNKNKVLIGENKKKVRRMDIKYPFFINVHLRKK